MKRNKRHRHRHYIPGRDQDAATLAARLAPPEEKAQQSAPAPAGARSNGGTIVVDTGALNLPAGFAKKDKGRRLGLEPVVVVIVALALAFIAFVAWRITRMPPAAGDPTPNSIEQGRPSPAPGG